MENGETIVIPCERSESFRASAFGIGWAVRARRIDGKCHFTVYHNHGDAPGISGRWKCLFEKMDTEGITSTTIPSDGRLGVYACARRLGKAAILRWHSPGFHTLTLLPK